MSDGGAVPASDVASVKGTLEPLPVHVLNGMAQVAFRKLKNHEDVAEIVQDVHAEYMRGRVPKDLLLKAAKLRAIDRFRERAPRERAVILHMASADTVVPKKSGESETDIVDMSAQTPSGSDDITEAVAALFVPGGRNRVARRGRTIANVRRNEQRILGRLIVRQERERGSEKDWDGLGRWLAAGRGRTNRQDMKHALAAVRQCGFLAPSHRKPAPNQPKTGLEESRGNSPARSE
jgi:hypothetical protein